MFRAWKWLAIVIGGTIGLGFAVHAIAARRSGRAASDGQTVTSGGFADGRRSRRWVLLPDEPEQLGNIAFCRARARCSRSTLLKGW